MPTASPNPKVDFYFSKAKKWQAELRHLRTIVLAGVLTEELKWGVPCYTFQGGNVLLVHAFKHYCAVLFPKGALLNDPAGVLIQQTENTQAARQLRFASMAEIAALEPTLQAYVREAVELEMAGAKVAFKKTAAFEVPAEFEQKLAALPALKTAFAALTPGRQRAYLMHFAAPKQAKTREARVAKCTQAIFEGKGLNE